MKLNHFKFYILLCFFLINLGSINAQQDSLRRFLKLSKKNTIHGSVGTALLGYTANIFYDRMLSESQDRRFSTFARVGYQSNLIIFTPAGRAFILEGGMLTGSNFGHFEGALGVTYIQVGNDVLRPAFSVGYRGQKPTGNFMFRTGLGFPELLYFGIGLAF